MHRNSSYNPQQEKGDRPPALPDKVSKRVYFLFANILTIVDILCQ